MEKRLISLESFWLSKRWRKMWKLEQGVRWEQLSLFVPHSNNLNSQKLNPDFVLDCIDNIDTKVRHRLRKDHGIEGGIPVVFSLEKPKAQLLPFRGPSGEEDNPSDYQVRMLASYFCSFKVLCLIT
ncbi:hypothetical protein GOBAR_DD18261 [Gossypium barbadense]|nr:hypothetical protein GOBAR_DD18261 [Gossypium barbadense]